ncbi:MAG: hypothetical protein QNK04_12960 [Myxococcota bacterium]|nr:hypothetical protein [Myxococcota bacterium]
MSEFGSRPSPRSAVSVMSMPLVMRRRWSTEIAARGSSLPRHSRIAPGAYTSRAPCCTRTPASVAVTLLAMDQPGRLVRGVIPSA